MIDTTRGLVGISNWVVGVINTIIPVLVALSIVLFFIGVVKYIRHEGEHENRDIMIWSLVVLFVLLSMWGLLRFMCSTFTGSGSCNNTPGADSAPYDAFRG